MTFPHEEPDPSGAVPRHAADHKRRQSASARHRNRRRVLAVGGVVALLLVAAVASLGFDALRARDAAAAARTEVRTLQSQIEAGDATGASTTLTGLQAHARTAYLRTHGPLWSAAGVVPWVGTNVRAVQTVSTVVDNLAAHVLPSLMKATDLVSPASLAPVNGRVNLAPLVAAAPEVIGANAAVQEAARELDEIATGSLVAPVAGPITELRSQVREVAATTATAARAVQLIPPMLGADGPRTYLLLVQNNAELRATGGMPGAIIVLKADAGEVEVVSQHSAGGSLAEFSQPVLPLSASEKALFGDGLGLYISGVTFTPDFPRSAELARAIWLRKVGGPIDGVLSIDPGVLAAVLGATGPVTLSDGTVLTADSAVKMLLNTVYLDIAKPAQQDAFFAETAASVFRAIVHGHWSPVAMISELARVAREGRLMVWSAHKNEQALLSGTVLSGALVGAQGDSPVIGVYLNDGTEAKMGYYLRTDVVATPTQCRTDGSQTVTVTVTLTNTAPANAATLPPSVVGYKTVVPPGEVQTNVLLYAPTGGHVTNVRASSGAQGVFSQTHDGLAVVGKTVQLKPGESITLDYDVVTGPGEVGTPVLRVTPTALGSSAIGAGPRCS